jgi:hydrogenase maturation protease
MQTECLVRSLGEPPVIEGCVRFLQPMWREVGVLPTPLPELPRGLEPEFRLVPKLVHNGEIYQTWQEAVERRVLMPPMALQSGRQGLRSHPFTFPAARTFEPLRDRQGVVVAVLLRRQEALAGELEIQALPWDGQIFKTTVRILNTTALAPGLCEDNDAVLTRTFTSAHTVLTVKQGEFISLTDPPAELREAANACKNLGAWPVLVGEESRAERDTMLSSSIILPDYPRIAPESRGDYFDGTEIDEMLALRVKTMTEDEKREMQSVDRQARRILERTDGLAPDEFLKLHGILRDVRSTEEFFNPPQRLERVMAKGRDLKPGDRVRIHPQGRADAMDMLLAGKIGIVEAIEQDAEERVHLALVLEDDPGQDLGRLRQPGHRFFYRLDEIQPLNEAIT